MNVSVASSCFSTLTSSNVKFCRVSALDSIYRAPDRMRKKFKDYAEIFGHIMRKHALIMQKLHRIMRKFKQFIELIIKINPVQCIYMLMVNEDSKLRPI